MPSRNTRPKPPTTEYKAIAAEWARAKRLKELESIAGAAGKNNGSSAADESQRVALEALEARRKTAFERRCFWTLGFWVWLLCMHIVGILLFTSGFLLTRLVLDERSECDSPPIEPLLEWKGRGSVDGGCWHPKTFNKAVVVLIDALRYDFTIPVEDKDTAAVYHNALPFLYETSVQSPGNAFLRPFIADPPTTTLQRLKGLTTGTLPTFVDMGSNFAGTAIEEDNLLMQWRGQGKRIVHLGDDTWTALFPGYFQPNISRAYDSLNVWDLHTVDNGVIDHIFPLLKPDKTQQWDILIGHLLGVDHAGHRYGPNHVAMTAKLQQMNTFIQDLVKEIDDETLLVVMGDHGMDGKGDHGGESDDEVEAALWMYSKTPIFGRTQPEFKTPPATAKIRPVNQIDLVPTLALLLGIPIPYNNLGQPIEEAFAGLKGNAWNHLAAASSIASAGIRRYQASYFQARGIEQSTQPGSPASLWNNAEALVQANIKSKSKPWKELYDAYTAYQEGTLRLCKDLWARFDIPKMVLGLLVMAFGVITLLLYVSRDEDEDFAVLDDAELDFAEKSLELQGSTGPEVASYKNLSRSLVKAGLISGGLIGVLSFTLVKTAESDEWLLAVAATAIGSILAVAGTLLKIRGIHILNLLPNTSWGWLSVIFTLSQSIGFASNSYTIWEDSISLFFLSTFGFASAISALQRPSIRDRALGVYHSILFVALGRLASFSKLCRDEQMPYCTSTYYASANSSTSAPWQLAIPFAVFLILPSIIKSYMGTSRSYEGLAPMWIGYVVRTALFLAAIYWTLDAADNGGWITSLSQTMLKTIHVSIAQLVLALVVVAGTTAFIWAPPCVSISSTSANPRTAQITVLGYGNVNGARYLFLPVNIACACILLSKPMGGGAIAIMLWQILSLAEILDLNDLSSETVGPVTLALLGNFHYFKTGHQAVLASIQWDSAFVPLLTIRYPWSPLAVALNTFAAQILAAAAVPLLVLWKTSPKRKGGLESASRALAAFVAYYAVESLATMAWAGHLRRHLMLYRVFSPRFMMAAAVLVIVDLVGIAVALLGVRTNTLAISEVFGFAD
ncbi:GPI ethanolamine phosphate transferase [Annulohypoxylon bovei var. microspora]|nr:GPI ethanolamine phosphate transferase [Annulohypoxylon bovei var. microspora]